MLCNSLPVQLLEKYIGYTNSSWVGGSNELLNRLNTPSKCTFVLGKLPVPGRPTNRRIVSQGPTLLAEGAVGGCFEILFSLFFLPLSEGWPDMD